MINFLKDNKGIALMLTILIISLIVASTLQFNTSMWSNLHAATNLSDGIKLGCIARSGLNGALAVLYEDASSGGTDTLRERWAQLGFFSEISGSLFDEGLLRMEISDLSGRIQINNLVSDNGNYNDIYKALLIRFLSLPEFDIKDEEVEDIVDAIKDWIDKDNEVTGFGAEDSYYSGLNEPYPCKNGPIEFLEELLLIKGINKELLYGSGEKPGIFYYFSSQGNGRININTAKPLVLRALSDQIDKDLADDIVSYRQNEDNDLSNIGWYKQVSGMSDVVIPGSLISTSSTYFEIVSEGLKGSMMKKIRAVVERKEKKLKILSWKVE
jgi:general secretion pathway protein K